jgi:hypothetical protein
MLPLIYDEAPSFESQDIEAHPVPVSVGKSA